VRIALLGPPGAGKGSLAALFEERLGVPHLSTGEIFRQEMERRTALGRRVQGYVTSGRLVPDALVVQVMVKRLANPRLASSYLLDGFPRTVGQARGLDAVINKARRPLDAAVYLESPRDLLVRRLSGRMVCPACGANYHVRTMRPKRANRCDRCGSMLTTRKDDQPATIRKRLAIDHAKAAPLLRYYQRLGKLHRLNGIGRIDLVFVRALVLCRRQRWVAARHD
jgi:adenylate kinase